MKLLNLYIKFFLFITLSIITHSSYSANYYWVGGTGNWDNLSHWATTSGGSTYHTQVPTANDNVIFDVNSFSGSGQIVTINVANALCYNMDWTGAANNPTLNTSSSGNILKIYGSLTLISGMTFSFNGTTNFEASTSGHTITMAGKQFNNTIYFNGAGGEWTLQDALTVSGTIYHNYGTFITNDKQVSVNSYWSSTFNDTRVLTLGSSLFIISGQFYIQNFINYTINPGTSTIRITSNNSLTIWNASTDASFYNLEFTNAGGTATIWNNTSYNFIFNNVSFAGNGSIKGSNTYNGTLSLSTGKTYTLESSKTQTFGASGDISASGTCTSPIIINASSSGTKANFSKTSGTINIDYVQLTDNNAVGGATWNANNSSGNNVTGWNITPNPNYGLAYYWIGNGGNWNDPSHWSLSSGGAPNAAGCIPDASNDVYFDVNSFSATGQTVLINIASASCGNMDWTGSLNTPTFNYSGKTMKIYGSLTLISGMTLNANGTTNFEATTTGKTITSSGKSFSGNIYFNGTGGEWTLQDNFTTAGTIYHEYGTFITNSYQVSMNSYWSSTSSSTRVLNLGSSLFIISGQFYIQNYVNYTITPGTSTIRITSNNSLTIWNSSVNANFNNLEFTNASGTGTIWNNTSYSFIFNNVSFAGNGEIKGNNTFNGTLTMAIGKTYTFEINKTQTFGASGDIAATGNCTSPITIKSSSSGTKANFTKTSGTINIDYISLSDNNGSGGAVWNATNSTNSNTSGWNVTPNSNSGLAYYWIGGSGNWNDPNHWSLSSGGSPNVAGCIPDATNDVYFDANSGFIPASKTVTINVSNALCRSMDWTGSLNTPTFTTSSSGNNLKIYGSLTLINAMTFSFNGTTYFCSSSSGNTITTTGKQFNNSVYIYGNGGEWTLQDDLTVSGTLYHSYGTFITNDKTVTVSGYNSPPAIYNDTRILTLGSSLFIINGDFYIQNFVNYTINPGTSTIRFPGSNNLTIWNVEADADFYNVEFTNGSGSNTIYNNDATHTFTFNDLSFAGNGTLKGNNIINGTLTFTAGKTYTFEIGKTQTLNGNWVVQGTCLASIILQSSSAGTFSSITKSSGSVIGFNLHIQDIHTSGGANFEAYNSVDLGGNTGWNFSSLPSLGNPLNITGQDTVCTGQSGIDYYIAPVTGAISYSWTVPTDAIILSGQGDTLITVDFATATSGDITVEAFNGCGYSAPSVLSVTILSGGAASISISVNPSDTVCSGANVTFTASTISGGSSPGFQWQKNGIDLPGETDSTYSTTTLNDNDIIRCILTSALPCSSGVPDTSNEFTMLVRNAPSVFNVTGGGAYCAGDTGVIIGIDNSESGKKYQLYCEGSPLWAPFTGTGSAINFGNQIAAGTYTVVGIDTISACINNMNGNAIVIINNCYSQHLGISINTTGAFADSSAILDINDTTRGVLFPRLSDGQRDALISPASGLIIYNTTTNKINFYCSAGWYETGTASVSSTTGILNPGGGVAINNTGVSADNSAMLDVSNDNLGILIPRTLPGAILNPAEGLIIFNISSERINYFHSSTWIEVSGSFISSTTGSGSPSTYGCAINYTGITADQSAILDISVNDKGILLPRLTSLQRENLLPATGLLIYNLTNGTIEYFDGSEWKNLQ